MDGSLSFKGVIPLCRSEIGAKLESFMEDFARCQGEFVIIFVNEPKYPGRRLKF